MKVLFDAGRLGTYAPNEQVRVRVIQHYEGHPFVHLQEIWVGTDGVEHGSKRKVAFRLDDVDELNKLRQMLNAIEEYFDNADKEILT